MECNIIMEMNNTTFDCDANFCVTCGALLPLPDQSEFLRCKACGSMIDVKKLEGIKIYSFKKYNQDKLKSAEELERLRHMESAATDNGPVVKRQCPKCQHKKMTYTTRQTRSADEGQTVFYTCLKCGFTEQEYS